MDSVVPTAADSSVYSEKVEVFLSEKEQKAHQYSI